MESNKLQQLENTKKIEDITARQLRNLRTKITAKTIEVNPENIFLRKVTPSGNGAVIPFLKSFAGKEVYIVIKDGSRLKWKMI